MNPVRTHASKLQCLAIMPILVSVAPWHGGWPRRTSIEAIRTSVKAIAPSQGYRPASPKPDQGNQPIWSPIAALRVQTKENRRVPTGERAGFGSARGWVCGSGGPRCPCLVLRSVGGRGEGGAHLKVMIRRPRPGRPSCLRPRPRCGCGWQLRGGWPFRGCCAGRSWRFHGPDRCAWNHS